MRAPSPSGRSHHVAGEDLATLGAGAQPGSLDHGVAEVVVGLVGRLPGAQPDPQSQGMLGGCVRSMHGLLHGHSTGEGSRRGVEGDHEAVAEVLHLPAVARRDGLAEHGEVRSGAARRPPRG